MDGIMTPRIKNILDGCGDGNPTVSLSADDAQSIGLEAGSYTADQIRKAGEPAGEPQNDPPKGKAKSR
jgi:hypothetical protein